MKKSKFIAIGLLALSISACTHKKHKHPVSPQRTNYYVRTDPNAGYVQSYPNSFVWFYLMYHLNRSGGIEHTSSSAFKGATGGSHFTSGRSVSRGGFGSSGHSSVSS